MFRQILKNDVADILDREPTEKELQLFIDEIKNLYHDFEADGIKVFISTVESWLTRIRDDNFQQCQQCGEYYLIDSDNWNAYEDEPICRNCKDYPDPDMMPGGHDCY